METAHRRIELQSPADLTYLVNNATRAARAKIDLHFPPSAAPETGDDDMRKRVEVLVDQYITQTFSLTHPSLSINGLEGPALTASLATPTVSPPDGKNPTTTSSSPPEDLEPYDTRLAARIQTLTSQIESLNLALADARRTAPALAANAYLTAQKQRGEEWEQTRKDGEERSLREAVEGVGRIGGEGGAAVGDEQRVEGMREVWEGACKGLVGLKEGIGGTTARLERARRAVEFLDQKG